MQRPRGVGEPVAMSRHPKVLTYHTVLAERPREELFLYAQPTAAEFEAQVRFLKQRCTPVSASIYLEILEGRVRCPRNAVLVTFDDGFVGCWRAARILRRYGVPSVLFLAVDYVGTHRWPWYVALDQLIEASEGECVEWRGEAFPLARLSQRKVFRDRFKTLYLRAPEADRQPLLDELAKCLGTRLPERPEGERAFLDWDRVRELAREDPLVEIGSHGLSHHDLTTLDDIGLEAEMKESRRRIREQCGRDPRLFSYPDGRCDVRVSAAAGAVYRAAFALRDGDRADRNRLPRLPVTAGAEDAIRQALSPWSGPRERFWRWRAQRGWIR